MVDTSAPASRLDTDPRRAHVSLSKHPYQIGVFGSGTIGPRVYELAYQVGAEIAKQGHILISGGMTGTMEASSRGASDADGLVVGVLPGDKFTDGNAYSTIKILSGMQFARNYITGLSCHGAIVVGGSSGAYEEARRVWEGRGPVVVLANSGSPTGASAQMLVHAGDLWGRLSGGQTQALASLFGGNPRRIGVACHWPDPERICPT
ncbi:conserved hypothetical protein [Mycobacterium tuberculosis C]|nr:conserved hypothetical protein [Mycobacterium tuberculosis C]